MSRFVIIFVERALKWYIYYNHPATQQTTSGLSGGHGQFRLPVQLETMNNCDTHLHSTRTPIYSGADKAFGLLRLAVRAFM
jgi:hypothetical protein